MWITVIKFVFIAIITCTESSKPETRSDSVSVRSQRGVKWLFDDVPRGNQFDDGISAHNGNINRNNKATIQQGYYNSRYQPNQRQTNKLPSNKQLRQTKREQGAYRPSNKVPLNRQQGVPERWVSKNYPWQQNPYLKKTDSNVGGRRSGIGSSSNRDPRYRQQNSKQRQTSTRSRYQMKTNLPQGNQYLLPKKVRDQTQLRSETQRDRSNMGQSRQFQFRNTQTRQPQQRRVVLPPRTQVRSQPRQTNNRVRRPQNQGQRPFRRGQSSRSKEINPIRRHTQPTLRNTRGNNRQTLESSKARYFSRSEVRPRTIPVKRVIVGPSMRYGQPSRQTRQDLSVVTNQKIIAWRPPPTPTRVRSTRTQPLRGRPTSLQPIKGIPTFRQPIRGRSTLTSNRQNPFLNNPVYMGQGAIERQRIDSQISVDSNQKGAGFGGRRLSDNVESGREIRNNNQQSATERREETNKCSNYAEKGSCHFFRCFEQKHPCPIENNFMINVGLRLCETTDRRVGEFNIDGQKYMQKVRHCQMKQMMYLYNQQNVPCDHINTIGLASLVPETSTDCFSVDSQFCDIARDPQHAVGLFHIFGGTGIVEYKLLMHFAKILERCDQKAKDVFKENYAIKVALEMKAKGVRFENDTLVGLEAEERSKEWVDPLTAENLNIIHSNRDVTSQVRPIVLLNSRSPYAKKLINLQQVINPGFRQGYQHVNNPQPFERKPLPRGLNFRQSVYETPIAPRLTLRLPQQNPILPRTQTLITPRRIGQNINPSQIKPNNPFFLLKLNQFPGQQLNTRPFGLPTHSNIDPRLRVLSKNHNVLRQTSIRSLNPFLQQLQMEATQDRIIADQRKFLVDHALNSRSGISPVIQSMQNHRMPLGNPIVARSTPNLLPTNSFNNMGPRYVVRLQGAAPNLRGLNSVPQIGSLLRNNYISPIQRPPLTLPMSYNTRRGSPFKPIPGFHRQDGPKYAAIPIRTLG